MNIVMTEMGGFIELQGTGEDGDFSKEQLHQMITLGEQGITEITSIQKAVLRSNQGFISLNFWQRNKNGEFSNKVPSICH